MSRLGRSLAVRDQAVSTFSGALMRLCDATAARGAALVDAEGETVDYAGCLEPYEIRVVAAEWRLILGALIEQGGLHGATSEIFYRGKKRSFAVISMGDGYALVIELSRTSFQPSPRAVSEAVRLLSLEAGLPLLPSTRFGRECWTRVDVRWERHKRRPTAIWLLGGWKHVEVLGRFAEAGPGQRTVGYRVRLVDSSELTLVREPMGIWYADDLPTHSPI
jgi:hypothetical protein